MRVVHPDVDFPGKSGRGRSSEGTDVVRQKIEGGSEEEDDGTDEEGASTTTSTRHINVKSELWEKG